MAKILVIGSVNVDLIGIGNDPLKPHDSNIGNINIFVGGVGKNIAENLYRLRMDVSFLTFIGNDHFAKIITDYLDRLGINYQKSIRLDQCSGTYLAIHDPDGSLNLGINDLRLIESIDPFLVLAQKEYLDLFDTIVMDVNLPQKLIDQLFTFFHDKTIIVDGVSQAKVTRIKNHLSQINLLKVNRHELAALLDHPIDDVIVSVQEVFSMGLEQIIVSDGNRPITYNIKNQVMQTPVIIPNHIISSVGSGDALLSGVIFGLTTNVLMPQAIEYGKQAAALTMEIVTPCHPLLTRASLTH
ncbi:MAG: PfkB family carbohydrate kinase [Candidatus Izemoplasmatales bacterium]|nr:PfkB family carbohydrate kinase [Candidatus Izemoplasmatales bacterium]